MGATVELAEIGEQKLEDGTKLKLPPLVFGQLGNDPNKKTVLIYGHLDVQPAALVFEQSFFISFILNLFYSSLMVGTVILLS